MQARADAIRRVANGSVRDPPSFSFAFVYARFAVPSLFLFAGGAQRRIRLKHFAPAERALRCVALCCEVQVMCDGVQALSAAASNSDFLLPSE